MDKWLEMLVAEYLKGNLAVVIGIIIAVIIWKHKSIEEFYERMVTGKVKFIKDSLLYAETDVGNKEFLKEQINHHIFLKVAKISADAQYRAVIINLVAVSDGDINYSSIAKTSRYLEMKNGKIFVKITGSAKFDNIFNYFMSSLMLLFFIAILSAVSNGVTMNFQQAMSVVVVEIVIFSFAVFLFFETIPIKIAKKISPTLIRLQP